MSHAAETLFCGEAWHLPPLHCHWHIILPQSHQQHTLHPIQHLPTLSNTLPHQLVPDPPPLASPCSPAGLVSRLSTTTHFSAPVHSAAVSFSSAPPTLCTHAHDMFHQYLLRQVSSSLLPPSVSPLRESLPPTALIWVFESDDPTEIWNWSKGCKP